MIRFTVTLHVVGLLAAFQVANGQCIVSQDSVTRQVITTCHLYLGSGPSSGGPLLTPPTASKLI